MLLQRWRNKVAQKSVDFVVCDPATLRPLVVIELVEPSHATPERQTRDDEVGDILKAAGLQFIVWPTQRGYNTHQLAESLSPFFR